MREQSILVLRSPAPLGLVISDTSQEFPPVTVQLGFPDPWDLQQRGVGTRSVALENTI